MMRIIGHVDAIYGMPVKNSEVRCLRLYCIHKVPVTFFSTGCVGLRYIAITPYMSQSHTKTVESWLLPSPPSQSGRVIIKHVKNAAVFVYNAALLSRTCHHNATLTQSFDRTLRLRFGQSHHLLQVSRVDNRLCNQIRQYTPNGGIGTHTAQIRTRFIQLFA